MKLFSIFNNDKGVNTLKIGGGLYSIEVPKIYLWEYDKEDTLLFYPKGDETITLRVTVLSFERKDGKPSHGADIVLEEAVSKNFKHEILSEGIVLSEAPPEQTTEGDTELNMQFWYLGRNNSLIIFSSTTLVEHEDSKVVLQMRSDLPQIFRSVKTM
ncbi:hypothetical protein [Ferruginibacter sp. SUN106]|uniref:hypothetical protein n=1 Tax=Ferruginibacter sp. SUN106 TaxID=2978348 RepID=UPI003D35C993